MERTRLERKSVYYWLTDLFSDAPFIDICEEFPLDEELKLPTISITSGPVNANPFQLGSDDLTWRNWYVDIFAENSGQRDDYADRVFNSLADNICVYDYNDGFPPDTTPDQIGSLVVVSRSHQPVRVFKDLVKKLYWRSQISFTTRPDSTD